MLKTLNASEWETKILGEGDARYVAGEKRSVVLTGDWKQGHDGGVEIEVRCATPVEINGLTDTGETILLAWGQFAYFKGRLLGFSGLEVVATDNFAIRLASKSRYLEVPDPVPTVILADTSTKKPLEDAIREELMKYIGRRDAAGVLQTEEDVNEFLDDVFHGDHEFEEEEDRFGLPSLRGFEEEDLEPEDGDEPAPPMQTPAPAEPPQAAKSGTSVDPKKKGGGAKTTRRSQEADSPDEDE